MDVGVTPRFCEKISNVVTLLTEMALCALWISSIYRSVDPPQKKRIEMLSNLSELANLIQLKVYALPFLDYDGSMLQKNICP